MKLVVLYRPNSEQGRLVEDFVRDFQKQRSQSSVESLSLDSKDGADKAALYEVVQYPAILVTRDDGQMVKMWQGEQLPLMNEVAAYLGV